MGIKWEDIDLDRSTVFVRRALQRVVKEDGSTELQLVEPKSDRSYRIVSIPTSIVAFLTRHRARQKDDPSDPMQHEDGDRVRGGPGCARKAVPCGSRGIFRTE